MSNHPTRTILALLTFVLLVTVNLTSCRTLAPVSTIVQHDTVYLSNRHHDSTYEYHHDSTIVSYRPSASNDALLPSTSYLLPMVDTVVIEHWRDRWKNHEIVRIDTVYQTRTLTKTETITAKEVPRFYKWCTLFFWMLVILFLGYLIFRIMKAIYLRK